MYTFNFTYAPLNVYINNKVIKVRTTYVTIFNGLAVLVTGSARQSINDSDVKSIARRVAIKKALKKINNKSVRSLIWHDYLNRK